MAVLGQFGVEVARDLQPRLFAHQAAVKEEGELRRLRRVAVRGAQGAQRLCKLAGGRVECPRRAQRAIRGKVDDMQLGVQGHGNLARLRMLNEASPCGSLASDS